jgi:pimeloyl-ACP methyl ester carboxylesterase
VKLTTACLLLALPAAALAQSSGYVTVSDGARLFYRTSGHPGPGIDTIEEWVTSMPRGMATLLRVPRAAHFTYMERPDIVWPAVEKFLSSR